MNAKKKTTAVNHDPQVIDLEPEAIIDQEAVDNLSIPEEPVAESREPDAPPTPVLEQKRNRSWPLPLAALVAGTILGGWMYRDVLASYFPTPQMQALEQRLLGLEQSSAAASEQLTGQGRLLEQLKNDVDALEAQQAGAAGENSKIASDIAAINQSLAARSKETSDLREDFLALQSTAPATSAASGTIDPTALTSIAARIDALEKDVASLRAQESSAPDTTVLSQSLSDMKAKIAAGAPYEEDMARIARMVPAAAGLETLAANANTGLPNARQLAQQLRDMQPSLPQTTQPAAVDETGYWGKFTSLLGGIIKVRPMDVADWQDVAAKAASLADEADLAAAIELIASAPGDLPETLQAWSNLATQRVKLEGALSGLSEAIARQIAAKG